MLFLIISWGNPIVFFENFGKIRVVPVTDGIRRIPGVSSTETYISLDESFQREPYIDYLDK